MLHPRHVPDGEVKAMMDILPRIPAHKKSEFRRFITDRQSKVWSAIAGMPYWIQPYLLNLDEYLRCKWEFDLQCYVIERVDTGLRCWIPLFYWRDEQSAARRLGPESILEILDTLRRGDMRRFSSPEKYLEYKRAKAAAVRRSIETKAKDDLTGAISDMTEAQIQNFIAVETAMSTGERIKAQGDDAKFLNRVWDAQRQGRVADIPDESAAFNPGMQPGKYKRFGV